MKREMYTDRVLHTICAGETSNDYQRDNLWRTRQFEYTWLRTVSGHYADFWKVTEDALVFATNMLKVELSLEKRQRLMQAYLELKSYPDALPALKWLREAGIRLAFVSTRAPPIVDSAIKSSVWEGIFHPSLTTH